MRTRSVATTAGPGEGQFGPNSPTWRAISDESVDCRPRSLRLHQRPGFCGRVPWSAARGSPHFDRVETAVAHVDVRGPTYKGSLTGGAKSLFRLSLKGTLLPRLVLTEAAIDALSIAAIESLRRDTLYAAACHRWTAWGRARSLRSRRLLVNVADAPLARSSAAPRTPMDRASALPTGTGSLRGKIRHPVRAAAASHRGWGLEQTVLCAQSGSNRSGSRRKAECLKRSSRPSRSCG